VCIVLAVGTAVMFSTSPVKGSTSVVRQVLQASRAVRCSVAGISVK
jgi:hypothetical protein